MDVEALRHLYLRRVIRPFFGTMGLGITSRIARFFAEGIFNLQTDGRCRCERRICDALGLHAGDGRVTDISKGMYEHLGRFWSEVLFMRRRLRESSWRQFVSVANADRLERLARDRAGCVVCTSHFGNPAVCAFVLGQFFRPIHVLVDLAAHPSLRAWQRELFAFPGIQIIERHEGRHVPSLLENGKAVLFIAETERRRGRAQEVDFLGRRLSCYPTIDRLAQWCGAKVLTATCHRTERLFTFQLDAGEPNQENAGEGSLLQKTLAQLERAILQRPEQYLWSVETTSDCAAERTARLKMEIVAPQLAHA